MLGLPGSAEPRFGWWQGGELPGEVLYPWMTLKPLCLRYPAWSHLVLGHAVIWDHCWHVRKGLSKEISLRAAFAVPKLS